MPHWVKIAENEADTVVELQQEEDGTVLMENLKNVFSQATTVKYRNPENNAWRVIKCVDDILHPPEAEGWGDHVYVVVVPKGRQVERKRKAVSASPPVESPPSVMNKAIYVLFDANGDLSSSFHLQKLCDCVRQHPDWSLAHIAVACEYPDLLSHFR